MSLRDWLQSPNSSESLNVLARLLATAHLQHLLQVGL